MNGYLDPEFAAVQVEVDKQNAILSHTRATNLPEYKKIWRNMPAALPDACPTDVEIENMMVPVSDGTEIEVRIYKKANVPLDAWMYFSCHGGGWTVGSHEVEGGVCRYVASKTGCVVVSADYRMAPEYQYPFAINDCFDILKWAKENPSKVGVNPEKVIIGGSSAGGNLTAALAHKARDYGIGVQGQVINIPNITHPKLFPREKYKYESTTEFEACSVLNTAEMTWFWDQYLPNLDRSPYASPILAESFEGLPPALVQVAGLDPLRDEGFAYAKALKDAGVPVVEHFFPGLPHCWYFFPNFKKTAEYYENIVQWIRTLQSRP